MNENFETLFENSKYSQEIKKGQIVQADVINITSDHAILNSGLKSESAVSISQFKDLDGEIEIKIGDTIEVSLEDIEDGEGQTKLSRQKAKNEATWKEIMKAFEENSIINGIIKSRVKGGFTVLIGQINAFLPGSLVDVRPVRDTQYLEGTNSEFKVIKAEKKANNIVLSRKAAIQGDNIESKTELIEKINEGDTIEGIVKNLTDYGAFIDLGGIDGLLHITDISWKKIKHPSQHLSIADKIKVKVLALDKEKHRVSLGLKQLDQDPWDKIIEEFEIGDKITCGISNITDYGLFVEIKDGIEGLVHVSEIDWTNNNPNPHKIAKTGDEVEVMILDIDSEKRRISLGIKQCLPNPWENYSQNFSINDRIKGTIKSITDFGIFIGLQGNIDGLIHVSDISWESEDTINLGDYKKGTEIEAVILTIDPQRQRISLGIKQLQDDPFTVFMANNKKGKIVNGVAGAIDERNALVLIDGNIKGLLNISEVASQENLQDVRTVLKSGDEIEAIIIGYNKKSRTVKLSIKAKEETEERKALEAYKADESESIAKTSLGDLLKSKFIKKDNSE